MPISDELGGCSLSVVGRRAAGDRFGVLHVAHAITDVHVERQSAVAARPSEPDTRPPDRPANRDQALRRVARRRRTRRF
jgi:hypothetical protein